MHDLQTFALRRPGKEVEQIQHALLSQIPCLQDVVGGQVLLLSRRVEVLRGRDSEVPAFVLVEDTSEDGRGVELGPAHHVDGAVGGDEGGGAHVADEAVLFELVRGFVSRETLDFSRRIMFRYVLFSCL